MSAFTFRHLRAPPRLHRERAAYRGLLVALGDVPEVDKVAEAAMAVLVGESCPIELVAAHCTHGQHTEPDGPVRSADAAWHMPHAPRFLPHHIGECRGASVRPRAGEYRPGWIARHLQDVEESP